jgi:hypothetical protein
MPRRLIRRNQFLAQRLLIQWSARASRRTLAGTATVGECGREEEEGDDRAVHDEECSAAALFSSPDGFVSVRLRF